MQETSYNRNERPGYESPLPFPPIKVSAPNKYYAEILMEDYAGVVSEFTAISQYSYHHFVSFANEAVAEMLENIAIVEMRHLEILAELIIKLGGVPAFRSGDIVRKASSPFFPGARYHPRWWNGSFVEYGRSLRSRLRLDLKSELAAIEAYQNHIKMIDDDFVNAVLERIILDEQVHVDLFKAAIEKYCADGKE